MSSHWDRVQDCERPCLDYKGGCTADMNYIIAALIMHHAVNVTIKFAIDSRLVRCAFLFGIQTRHDFGAWQINAQASFDKPVLVCKREN
jgi:hypothetical protein